MVAGVEQGSPADKPGMKRGDVITGANSQKIDDSTSLRNLVATMVAGTKVDVMAIRDGKEQTFTVELGEYKENKTVKSEYENVLKGVSVQELTSDLRSKLNLPDNVNGVVVSNVAGELGGQKLLRPNDVIQEVNRTSIQNLQDYKNAVSKVGEKDTVLLLIYRDGGSAYLTIQP